MNSFTYLALVLIMLITKKMLISPVVILDEATASVDVETERYIQDALEMLIKDKTTLIIAHRLSTIRNADQILFMDNGAIIEKGTHDELMKLGNRYARFCRYQENFIQA